MVAAAILFLCGSTLAAQSLSWQETNGPYGGNVSQVVSDQTGRVYAISDGIIFELVSFDHRWGALGFLGIEIKDMVIAPNGSFFIGTEGGGVGRSTNSGHEWTQANNGISNGFIWGVDVAQNGDVFAGSQFGAVFRSTDNGSSWQSIVQLPGNATIVRVAAGEADDLFVGTLASGVYHAVKNGAKWDLEHIDVAGTIGALLPLPDGLLLVGTDGHLSRFRSSEGGWTLEKDDAIEGTPKKIMLSNGTILVATTGALYTGTVESEDFVRIETTVPEQAESFTLVNGTLYVGTIDGIYKASFPDPSGVVTFVSYSTGLIVQSMRAMTVADSGVVLAGTTSGTIYRSTDNGAEWSQVAGPFVAAQRSLYAGVNGLTFGRGSVVASIYGAGVFRSTDNGRSWSTRNSGLPAGLEVVAVAIDSSGALLTSITGGGLYRSTNEGESWDELTVDDGLTFPVVVASNGDIVVGALRDVNRSTDNGETWSRVATVDFNIQSLLAMSDGTIYVGTLGLQNVMQGKLFRVGADGSVTQMLEDEGSVDAIVSAPGGIYAAMEGSGVYGSVDGAAPWVTLNTGLSDWYAMALAVDRQGNRIYLGAGTVFSASLPTSSSVAAGNEHGMRSALYDCSPNPAQGRTTIPFSLSGRSHADLEIYSVAGLRIATLVSDDLPAGSYSAEWDTHGVESGVYWYRLRTADGIETRRVVVVR